MTSSVETAGEGGTALRHVAGVDAATREAVSRLQERYIEAVDGKDMRGWLACFAEDGAYYVQGADNADDELPICLMMDDSYGRLQDRVTFVEDVWPGAFEDYQTRHFIQPLSLGHEGRAPGGGVLVRGRTNVTVFSSDQRGRTSIFVAGSYRDLIVVSGEQALFRERRVVMDTFTTPGVVVYPL